MGPLAGSTLHARRFLGRRGLDLGRFEQRGPCPALLNCRHHFQLLSLALLPTFDSLP